MEASDGKDLRRKLDEKGYFIVEYSEKKPKQGIFSTDIFPGLGKVNLNDISILSWQLYTMLDAGLTLLSSLKIITNQTKNKSLRSAIGDVWHRVEEGASFSESLREHPRIFSRLYVQMVNAGEIGGVLDEMLRRLAVFYEGQAEISSRVKSALTYPILLMVVSVGVAIFLVTYVLPKFVIVFEDMGVTVPLPTQILLQISVFITYYWYIILAVAAGTFMIFRFYVGTKGGYFKFDQLKLKLPVIGNLISKTTISRFAQTLSILISGGIPVLTCLDVVTETIGNTVVAKALKDVCSSVGEGKTIAQPLAESKLFPEMVVNMVRVGEETGALDKMLAKIADFYNKEVDNAIKTFTALIEPLLIVFMAVVIGFIAISIFLPMADIMEGLHQ
ncbi:MAG: type II secretion system F family protein [Candidatus Omnitrophica bacterium]|nr:type II secretion system F family protein [Candidatus Omnitrophota bacterium]